MESKDFTVACYNRTTEKVDNFVNGSAKGKNIIGCHSIKELVVNIEKPRKVFSMVKAGAAVDAMIERLIPELEPGDIIIEGGNSHFVKMVHNGIEYGDMQLICESYQLMRDLLGMSDDDLDPQLLRRLYDRASSGEPPAGAARLFRRAYLRASRQAARGVLPYELDRSRR